MSPAVDIDSARQRVRQSPDAADDPDPPATGRLYDFTQGVPDLREAMDDATRVLLSRPREARRGRLVFRSLVAADLVGLVSAYVIATMLWDQHGALGSLREATVFVCLLPCWVLIAHVAGLYDHDRERHEHSTVDDLFGIVRLVTVGAWLLLMGLRLTGHVTPAINTLLGYWLISMCLVLVARILCRSACRRRSAYQQNTVIVGAGDVGQLIARKLIRHPEYGANVVGFVDRNPRARRTDLPDRLAILGGPERLPEIIRSLDVERVVLAFSREHDPDLVPLLRQLRPLAAQIDVVPRLFELVGPRSTAHMVEGMPLVGLPPLPSRRLARATKRTLDVSIATIALILLAPLMGLVALRIRLYGDGSVLFRQRRLGYGMREFTVYKFRTTKTAHQEPKRSARDLVEQPATDTTTPLGSWLCRTSLDDLPQLLNVLRGEMSLVGPRPCVVSDVEHFDIQHLERFTVPQGITGLWQVTARGISTLSESLDIDLTYVRKWSLGLDLRLLLHTPAQVLRPRTVSA